MSSVDDGSLLESCLGRLEWTPERLAAEINRVRGPNTITKKAPYAWLKGTTPRGPIADTVASLLTSNLGEPVAARDLWPKIGTKRGTSRRADEGLAVAWTDEGTQAVASVLASAAPPMNQGRPTTLTGDELTAPALEWLTADEAAVAGRVVGTQDITVEVLQALESRVAQLRALDDSQGGPLVLAWISQDMGWVAQLIRDGTYPPESGVRLHLILAELAQLGGWLACDQGQVGLGQRLLLAGLHAAHTAGDRALGANIISCLSYQSTWSGAHRDALRLIKAASHGARELGPGRIHALLATREARAHAQLNDPEACSRALDTAAAAIEVAESRSEPRWTYWVTPAVLAADAGRAWLELERPERAAPLLERGLTLFGQEQPRNRMLHQASLAEARLALGDLDGAASAAHSSLDLSRHLRSDRARSRLRGLQSRFSLIRSALATEVVEHAKGTLGG